MNNTSLFERCKHAIIHNVMTDRALIKDLEAAIAEQAKPQATMSDEEVLKLWHSSLRVPHCDHYLHFYRAIEAHHNIGVKK